MNLSDETKRLLIITKQDIQNGDFDAAYERVERETINFNHLVEYTKALMVAGVRPEKYLKEIPAGYMWFYDDLQLDLVLPSSIREIGMFSFYHARLKSLTIQSPDIIIGDQSFDLFIGKIICSAETKKLIEKNNGELRNVEFQVV